MTTTMTDTATIPPITRREAPEIAATEFARVVDQLRSLNHDNWTQATDCPGWDVRAMAGHMLGMTEAQTSLTKFGRQFLASKRNAADGLAIDAMTASQVRDHAHLSTSELVDRFEAAAPRAVRGRRRIPAVVRATTFRSEGPFATERWKMGWLFDVILTRDPWMHRSEIARATGRELALTPEHDGRIVADVVAEWTRRHGQPCTLMLTGPAGGAYTARGGGEEHCLDAVEFCRTVSGRGDGEGLLRTPVPF